MKRTSVFIIMTVAAALTLNPGCGREGAEGGGPGDPAASSGPVSVRIHAGAATKADGNLWTADHIGVIVSDAPGTSSMASDYLNCEYATATTGETSADFSPCTDGDRILFDDGGTVTFTAYGPYETGSANALPGSGGVISGTVESQSDPTAVDWLYAGAETADMADPDVNFSFTHVMSKVIISVIDKSGISADAVIAGTYTLNTVLTGKFDVTPGSTTVGTAYADGTAGEWTISGNCPSETVYDSDDTTPLGIAYTMILYPGTIDTLPFSATIDGSPYGIDLNETGFGSFDAGKTYSITLKLSETALTVVGSTVSDWDNTDCDGLTLGGFPAD